MIKLNDPYKKRAILEAFHDGKINEGRVSVLLKAYCSFTGNVYTTAGFKERNNIGHCDITLVENKKENIIGIVATYTLSESLTIQMFNVDNNYEIVQDEYSVKTSHAFITIENSENEIQQMLTLSYLKAVHSTGENTKCHMATFENIKKCTHLRRNDEVFYNLAYIESMLFKHRCFSTVLEHVTNYSVDSVFKAEYESIDSERHVCKMIKMPVRLAGKERLFQAYSREIKTTITDVKKGTVVVKEGILIPIYNVVNVDNLTPKGLDMFFDNMLQEYCLDKK